MSHSDIRSIILAGGSGTRLWPLSRKYYPKQFISLPEFGGKSLFQKTLERAAAVSKVGDIRIVTNCHYKFHCLTQAEELGIDLSEKNLVIEPEAKNTLAAIFLGVDSLPDGSDILVLPSDHIIHDEARFVQKIRDAVPSAKKNIVTFGIAPSDPKTGYGYIRAKTSGTEPFDVLEFKEKPDLETAKKYVEAGYLWNAGIFLFSKEIFLSELRRVDPEYVQTFSSSKDLSWVFVKLPDLSIDYGLLEKSDRVKVMPLPLYWNDLGSFDALEEYARIAGGGTDIAEIEASGNYAVSDSDKKAVVFIGCDDLLAIDTRDALLIVKKGSSQKVKEAVNLLQKERNELVEYHTTVYRPWGSYTIIDEGEGFKSKRLTVLPGKKLSLQMHYHRSEHWVVVSGTAKVTVGNEERILKKWESTFIPAGTNHRLENPGKVVAHLIESQIGDYLGEDDIVRFDDAFGRK